MVTMPERPDPTPDAPRRAVVVGGGIAALETMLALHELAPGRVDMTLVAPEPDFSLRPLSVSVPFGRGGAKTIPLADVVAEHDATFVRDAVFAVEPDRRVVVCAGGSELPYDDLVLTPGARAVSAYDRGLTFDPHEAGALSGVVADLEQGWSHSVAFVVPPGCTWPLPLYELALMTAEQVWGMGIDGVTIHLITPEAAPLDVFGKEASDALAELLKAGHITFHGSADAQVHRAGQVDIGNGKTIDVDRIVAIPLLTGPRIAGVPADEEGFIAIDEYGRVPGLEGVWAAGDGTQQPIKQGGLACQQADAIAGQIAAKAGADVQVGPAVLVLRGRLLAGQQDRFLHRTVGMERSQAESKALWWPPAKVASRHLAPYLEGKGLVAPDPSEPRSEGTVDVHVPIDWTSSNRPDRLGLSSLG